MSSKKPAPPGDRNSRRGSNRPARGKLRRFHDVENVIVEEPFNLFKPSGGAGGGGSEEDRKAGDGCYVSATVHNRRYYGLLVDQEALKNASLLWFQEEAATLDLNRRMKMLHSEVPSEEESASGGADGDKKRPGTTNDTPGGELSAKRIKLEHGGSSAATPDAISSNVTTTAGGSDANQPASLGHQRQVQKFRYAQPKDKKNDKDLGYRYLLATFADVGAASEDDPEKARQLEEACQAGGGYVGKYYYQYEIMRNALQAAIAISDKADDTMRTSMGFDSFLHGTQLPRWFPLSNLHIGQHKVLSLMNMKKDNNGNVIYDAEAANIGAAALKGTHVNMESRARYRVGVMGGGIAGLACCLEILRLCDSQKIDVEVVLMEGRSRLGGRLFTDRETFKYEDGKTPFPVDLGAGWIHGIDHNPLASLAREAGVSFVTASEEVKMMHSGQREVAKEVDDSMGKLFDDLLDIGADDIWGGNDSSEQGTRKQTAVRWYSANLSNASVVASKAAKEAKTSPEKNGQTDAELGLGRTDAPSHRFSSDVSIDHAIGKAIAKHKFREFSKLTKDQHSMLQWNMKNVEYALGANVSDLSMKFWDSDERHAFEGDHVLLKEGYSSVVEHMIKKLKKYGDMKFKVELDFPIGKVEYARRTTTQKYFDRTQRKFVELSDTCCVTAEDGKRSLKLDFAVCTLPLGVLKHSLSSEPEVSSASVGSNEKIENKVVFDPALPESKRDSINTVGFGLLDKLYLQFATPFWRETLGLARDGDLSFGNSSGLNAHLYMFTDFGLTLGNESDSPPILMTLISGKEAVQCEMLSDAEMVQEALETLRELLSPVEVPQPIAFKRTKWGADRFSRGCYTFLPPGATDQDFNMLQSPVNGNGDSLVLEGSETMRLFFAGEHTTALHPSMAHGAMLTGIRAAKEILSTLSFTFRNDKASDRLIPVALFRRDNPGTPLQCSLCDKMGSRVREGSLLALKRGARQVLVHNNCAEYSPEVEVYEGQWTNVIKAVNRGKSLNCALCSRSGATIGCTHPQCFRVYHFSCSEDTGWRFDREGKVYYCDLHRKLPEGNEADRVSLAFYRSKTPHADFRCFLCGGSDEAEEAGKLHAFQRNNKRVLVHEKCARFTTVVDTKEDNESRMGIEFGNIFEAIEKAGTCAKCGQHGSTIECAMCDLSYHYLCALETGWKSGKRGAKFLCESHQRNKHKSGSAVASDGSKIREGAPGGIFSHALFAGASGVGASKSSTPSNSEIGGTELKKQPSYEEIYISDDSSESDESTQSNDGVFKKSSKDLKLTSTPQVIAGLGESTQAVLARQGMKASWGIGFVAKKDAASEHYFLTVKKSVESHGELIDGQIVKSFEGVDVGTSFLGTFKEILVFLEKHTQVKVEVFKPPSVQAPVEVPSAVA